SNPQIGRLLFTIGDLVYFTQFSAINATTRAPFFSLDLVHHSGFSFPSGTMSGSHSPDLLLSNASLPCAPAPAKQRRTLRKSCHFCRSRKIKCSGDTICDACRERNIACSYKEGEPKGRPKSLSKTNSSHNVKKPQNVVEQPSEFCDDLPGPKHYSVDDESNSYPLFPAFSTVALPSLDRFGNPVNLRPDEVSIAARIASAFSWLDGNAHGTPTNLTDQKLASFREHTLRNDHAINQKFHSGPFDSDLSYEDVFFAIAQELMQLLALRLGEIGCSQLDYTRSHFFLKAYMADTSTTMFDTPSSLSTCQTHSVSSESTGSKFQNPLQHYDSHQMAQMMEIWFSQHPFSSMFSKTLLLRDIRQETYDDVLVAAMLGDVEAAHRTSESRAKSHALYTWASVRLNAISQDEPQLPTLQAIVLLGWRALCTGQARRALALLVWADANIRNVPILKAGVNVVNGIDVGEVEAESLCNTHWLTFSIYQWIMMQAQITARDLPHGDVPAALPPADTTLLAILRLDRASYSISTLQSQEGAYRELWLLSYVAAFTSQIYKLCPRISPPSLEVTTHSGGWQSHVLSRLRGLSDPLEDVLVICTQVRHVLTDLVPMIESQAQCSTSQALEISIAHTILIHLLLPSAGGMTDADLTTSTTLGARRILAAGGIQKLLSDFCCSVAALLKVFAVLKNTSLGLSRSVSITMSQRASTTDHIIFLALDASVRGLKSLWSLSRSGTEAEKFYLSERGHELQTLAGELHAFSKRLDRVDAARLACVIEQLEIVICQFLGLEVAEQGPSRSSSHASGSTSARGRTPPSDNMEISMQLQDHNFDLDDTSNMDFMSREMWNDLMPMPPLIGTNDWSI
ncbi:hypothetical protein LTR70_002219, partial [Exophiala xenobiotica]